MDTFALTASALPRFSLVVLTSVLFLAFALRPNKSQGSWWFVGVIAGFVLHHLAQMGLRTIYADWNGDVLIPLTWSSVLVGTWAALGFAYRLMGNPYPRESRAVLFASGILLFSAAAYIHATSGVGIGYDPDTGVDRLASALLLLHISAAVFVLVRRSRNPETPEATRRALRAFGSALSVGLVFPVFIFLQESGAISGWLFEQLSLVAWAAVIMAIVTAHVSYTPEPTSVLVKVVSFAFVAVVTALGVASAIAFREPLAAYGPLPTGLAFTPEDSGGYIVSDADGAIDDAPGEPLAIADRTPLRVPLGFAFPFADSLWREVLIDDDGYVSFGADSVQNLAEVNRGSPIPWIAPLLLGLSPTGEGVSIARDSASATVTWRDIPLTQSGTDTATAQLVLRGSGAVEFRYGPVPPGEPWVRGLSPGTPTASEPLALGAVARGRAAVENRWTARIEAESRRATPFAWLILGAGAFVLLAFPLYLREGLTRPLRRLLGGVRLAARGHLETEVPVGARDEIGVLAEDFNRMTGSLRTAEASLRAYADELESRVEERTAELATSLDELKSAQARLVQQEKMASLGALTAGIAHEIKNPLNFVNNFASLSRELVDELDDEEDPEEREAILADLKANAEKIEEHGRRADRIVRDMMDHARTGGGERQRLEVNALVTEYANLAYHGMRARHPETSVSLLFDLAGDAGTAPVVSQEIGRVLINLVDNAFDAVRLTPEAQPARASGAGTQTAGASGEGPLASAPTVTVSTRRDADAVEIRVADSGPGIAPEIAARVFEPFFTTKPTGSGTGLGLSMSYDIVTNGHGGTLTVESMPGEGAVFAVRLPLA